MQLQFPFNNDTRSTKSSMADIQQFEEFVMSQAWVTDKYWYPALGLAGETGELVDEVKKLIRDDGGVLNDRRRQKFILEAGDVLHYFIRLYKDFDVTIDEIIQGNVDKLTERRAKGAKVG
jgi:NTP pyrophosphatase (non-canonical NTP hydrolase)